MSLTDHKICLIIDVTSQKIEMFRASSRCYGVSKSIWEIPACLKFVIPLYGAEVSFSQKDEFRKKTLHLIMR